MDKKAKASVVLFIISIIICIAVTAWGIALFADAAHNDAEASINFGKPLVFVLFLFVGFAGCGLASLLNIIGTVLQKKSETAKKKYKITQFIFIFIPFVLWGICALTMYLTAV